MLSTAYGEANMGNKNHGGSHDDADFRSRIRTSINDVVYVHTIQYIIRVEFTCVYLYR